LPKPDVSFRLVVAIDAVKQTYRAGIGALDLGRRRGSEAAYDLYRP